LEQQAHKGRLVTLGLQGHKVLLVPLSWVRMGKMVTMVFLFKGHKEYKALPEQPEILAQQAQLVRLCFL
jgi:hypothetical protein